LEETIGLLATGMLSLMPMLAHATDADIRVLNIKGNLGTMRVAVCPEASFLRPTCPFIGNAPAHAGAVKVLVRGIPPGIYAVQAHHDANNNGLIDTNVIGIPSEGIGFSRGAPMRFGPPQFADAAVSIAGTLVGIDITLTFEP